MRELPLLPKSETQLLALADKVGLNHGLMISFLDANGGEFIHEAFIAYISQKLIDKDFLNETTPVGALAEARDMLGAIFNDFQTEFNQVNPE